MRHLSFDHVLVVLCANTTFDWCWRQCTQNETGQAPNPISLDFKSTDFHSFICSTLFPSCLFFDLVKSKYTTHTKHESKITSQTNTSTNHQSKGSSHRTKHDTPSKSESFHFIPIVESFLFWLPFSQELVKLKRFTVARSRWSHRVYRKQWNNKRKNTCNNGKITWTLRKLSFIHHIQVFITTNNSVKRNRMI